jgi:hypothetical protein
MNNKETKMNNYLSLRKIDVNEHTEKKGNLTYLSWAWAVDVLLQQDPLATWEYKQPLMFGDTMMVFCTVTAFNKAMTSQLPVMDYKNKAITNPDSMAVNTAMQRCLAKAIALHGLGLYIYAGEDTAPGDELDILSLVEEIQATKSVDELLKVYKGVFAKVQGNQGAVKAVIAAKDQMKITLGA